MEHLAILKKGLLAKILSGEKTIESRWYKTKKPPFNTLKQGDTIYFKESGSKVSARARVREIETYDNLSPNDVQFILSRYSAQLGVNVWKYDLIRDKTLCMLIFLQNPEKISPFPIRRCYGTAWISVDSIASLKIPA